MKSHWRLGCWVGAPASISLQTSAAVFGSGLSFVGMTRGGAMARCGFIGLVSALAEKFEWLSGALYLLPRAVSVPLWSPTALMNSPWIAVGWAAAKQLRIDSKSIINERDPVIGNSFYESIWKNIFNENDGWERDLIVMQNLFYKTTSPIHSSKDFQDVRRPKQQLSSFRGKV
jgi:hypothetical protein